MVRTSQKFIEGITTAITCRKSAGYILALTYALGAGQPALKKRRVRRACWDESATQDKVLYPL